MPSRLQPFLLLAVLLGAAAPSQAAPPNLVFILADDLGYGEAGCYGQAKIRTPHLDQLARDGLRFTRHYAGAPVCAPSRCVLLTGRHLGHAEIRNNRDSGNGKKFPGQFPLTEEALTIAEALKKAGYATGGFGKWGLGPTDTTGSPLRQGFDRFYGYNCQRNAHSYYPPFLDDDHGIEEINATPVPGHRRQTEGEVTAEAYRADTYAPDRILEEALAFLDRFGPAGKEGGAKAAAPGKGPFFLYLPFVEPHVAMQPPQEWVDRYPEEWDRDNGPYRGGSGYLPHPRPRAGYAAMISDLDEHVGAILKKLDDLGLRENTVVIFTSDNGTTHGGRNPRFGVGGVDSKFFNSTAGLRGFKGSVHEGGLRVPTIMRWPGVIAPGSTTDLPSYFPDWFPTLCTLAGTEAPSALDGMDLTPLLRGATPPERKKPMVWEFHGYGGQLAVMDGPWKAVRTGALRKKPGAWELYHLGNDPGEQHDLAAKHPDILQGLRDAYRADRSPNPNFPFPLLDGQAGPGAP